MEPSDHDVQQAVRDVQAGQTEAFAVLVDRYQEPLRATVLRFAPRPTLTDDLVQQAFVTAFEQLSEFDPGRNFGAWLLGIAHNLVRRAWDAEQRNHRHRDELTRHLRERLDGRMQDASFTSDPYLLQTLRNCVAKLPDRWRKIVQQHYHDQATAAEIALALDNSPSTVAVTLFRIRRRLKACVEKNNPRTGDRA